MLLFDCKFAKGLHLSIVTGKDIPKAVINANFLAPVLFDNTIADLPDCKLVEVRTLGYVWNHLVARALLWSAYDRRGFKYTVLDRVSPRDGEASDFPAIGRVLRDFLRDSVDYLVDEWVGDEALYVPIPEGVDTTGFRFNETFKYPTADGKYVSNKPRSMHQPLSYTLTTNTTSSSNIMWYDAVYDMMRHQ